MVKRIVLNFNAGTVKALAELPTTMKDAGLEELDVMATDMVTIAQILVRVDTGSLKKSIRKERHGDVIKVRAGGHVTNPKTGKIVNYAAIIESKFPFMQPAYDQAFANAVQRLEDKVAKECQQ